MDEESKQKLKELFDEYDKLAVESFQERQRVFEKKDLTETEREHAIQVDAYYRAWSQMSNSIRNKFPELWSEFNN